MVRPIDMSAMALLKPAYTILLLLSQFAIGSRLHHLSTSSELENKDFAGTLHNNFLRLAFHGSTVVGDTVYIDGGELNYIGSNVGTVTLNDTLTIDLTKSWTSTDMKFGVIPKYDPSVPILNHGALWPSVDDSTIYSFGGIRSSFPHSPTISSVKLWKYSSSNGWSGLASDSPSSPSITNTRPAVAAHTYGNGVGYVLGGVRGNGHAPFWPLPGLLTYDMVSNEWTNESTNSLTPFGAIGGSLTFVPDFGERGILIAMGGEYASSGSWMEQATNFVPFSNISIWDIASRTWYWQNAITNQDSLDMPPSATMFCSTGVSGPDGTYEIFIYGGHSDTFILSSKTPSQDNLHAQTVFDSVFVLSLPGFVWTRVNSGDAEPRTGHACELVGKSQMLSIGGLNPTFTFDAAQTFPDSFHQGLGVFDLIDLVWKDNFSVDTIEYTTPKILNSWYQTHNLSSIEWSSPGTEALFINTSSQPPAILPLVDTAANTTTNVVAPAVAGTVIGVILLVGTGFFLFRKYRKQKKQDSTSPAPCQDCRDGLRHTIRTRLSETRNSYLAQREAFLEQHQSHQPVSPKLASINVHQQVPGEGRISPLSPEDIGNHGTPASDPISPLNEDIPRCSASTRSGYSSIFEKPNSGFYGRHISPADPAAARPVASDRQKSAQAQYATRTISSSDVCEIENAGRGHAADLDGQTG